MKRSAVRKRSDKRGFTLIEALAVIAVLVIAASLAAPNVLQTWRKLKLMELDDTAREIFLSAQNELTGMKASGRLVKLAAEGSLLQRVSAPAGETAEIYALTAADAGGYFTQTADLMSTMSGSYVMDLDPANGDVTGIWYSSRADDLTNADVISMCGVDGFDSSDVRASANDAIRYQWNIGYYGGLRYHSSSTSGSGESPVGRTLKVVNGEDLYAEVTCPGLQAANEGGTLLATLTVRDEHGHVWSCTAGREGFVQTAFDGQKILGTDGLSAATQANRVKASLDSGGNYTVDFLLDSCTFNGDGLANAFTGICSGSGGASLTAGDNLTVSAVVTLQAAGGGTIRTMLEKTYPVTVNSLFGDRTDSGTAEAPETLFTASRARHLHNLEPYCLTASPGESVTLRITEDIDFSEISDSLMPGSTLTVDSFPALMLKNPCGSIALNGGGAVLKNFLITPIAEDPINDSAAVQSLKRSCAGDSGLVGCCDQALTLQNLYLEDPQVSGEQNVGALAGALECGTGPISVTGCRAYLSGGDSAGGVVCGETGDTNVGGLIGLAQSSGSAVVTVRDSFGALPVSNAGRNTGGLIGAADGGAIRRCYASGAVTGGDSNAGGLVGAADGNVSIEDCFVTSDVTARQNIGALAGRNGGSLLVQDTCAYGTVKETKHGAVTYGPMTGGGSGRETYDSCRYLSQSGDPAAADAYGANCPAGLTGCEYGALTVSGNDAQKCHPYDASLTPPFPFRMLTNTAGAVIPYYGDWPGEIQPVQAAYGLCYYEQYADSANVTSWGFYGYDRSGNPVDSLDDQNAKTIVAAGYGEMVSSGTPKEDISRPTLGWAAKTATLGDRIVIGNTGLDLYPLPYVETELTTHNNQIYRTVMDGQAGRTLYFNPLFAAALSLAPLKADVEQPMQIRTEAQLRNRSLITETGWYFKQTHHITVVRSDTGGTAVNNTGCTYDGAGNRISGLQNPLFLKNMGTLKNIRLVDVAIRSSSDTAALTPLNQSTITDCRVLSGSVVSTNGSAAGLVLTSNGGTITGCSVGTAGGEESVTITGSGYGNSAVGAAGLIGKTEGGAVVISGCTVTNLSVTNDSGRAAGFITFNRAAQSRITGCSVTDTTVSASYHSGGFCIDNLAAIRDCHVRNCTVSSAGSTYPYAGGFGYSNQQNGTITLCDATGITVTATDAACGFLFQNEAKINKCYAYVNSVAAKEAGGFLLKNPVSWNSAVTDCFVVGSASGAVTGTVKAGGFCTDNAGTCRRCYAAVSLTGSSGTIYGFGPSGGTAEDCYWCRDSGFNRGLETAFGAGTRILLTDLPSLMAAGGAYAAATTTDESGATIATWTLDNGGHTHPVQMTGDYPYPRLTELDYFGDWPTATAGQTTSGKLGAAVLYRQHWGNWSYEASGYLVDFSAGKIPQRYDARTKWNSNNPVCCLLMSGDLAESGEWTASCFYVNPRQSTDTYQEELDIRELTASSYPVSNVTGCRVYEIDPTPYVYHNYYSHSYLLDSVTFCNVDTGETYVFPYDDDNGTFTYGS